MDEQGVIESRPATAIAAREKTVLLHLPPYSHKGRMLEFSSALTDAGYSHGARQKFSGVVYEFSHEELVSCPGSFCSIDHSKNKVDIIMPDHSQPPMTSPGEIAQWPMLKIVYRTDREAIGKLLPPGIEPGEAPNVNLTIYNLPVNEEPEYGVLITIDAAYNGQTGEYAIGYGIDQEAAIMISAMMNGQPKFPCSTHYYRLGPTVSARCHHQGYTFLEFSGTADREDPLPGNFERFEWWTKYSRQVGGGEGYDFPPHVVKVHGKYGPGYRLALSGEVTLRESPWDPIATLLPLRKQLSAHLWWPEYRSRDITLEGRLDPEAFWPFVDTVGGSRWPGSLGAPKRPG